VDHIGFFDAGDDFETVAYFVAEGFSRLCKEREDVFEIREVDGDDFEFIFRVISIRDDFG